MLLIEAINLNEGHELVYMLEAAVNTFIINTELYPKVEAVLNEKRNQDKFKFLVGSFIDNNSMKLHTAGPQYLIPFTDTEKNKYYDLFGITPEEINDVMKEVLSQINAQADWKLIKNNPIFVLFFLVIRYFTIKKDEKATNMALTILSLALYPSTFTKYFNTFEPKESVMNYTIDNLTKKFNIKKTGNILGNLVVSIQQSWTFHKANIIQGSDKNCIDFIMRIKNDQNSFMKKISNEYYNADKAGLAVYTTKEEYDDNIVVDNENNTNKVMLVRDKVVLSLTTNGTDMTIANAAAQLCQVSKLDLYNYLIEITNVSHTADMERLIESALFLYMYDEHKTLEDIHSPEFIMFGKSIYKKTNSKNQNDITIKEILQDFIKEVGLTEKTHRQPTWNDYKRAIFLYFIFMIQKYA